MVISNSNIKDIKWISGKYKLPECWLKIKTPGVTSIISSEIPDPEMEDWIRKDGKEKVDEILKLAGFRGTGMHFFMKNFIDIYAKTKDTSEALKITQINSPKQLLEEGIPQNKIDEGRELFYKFYYSDFPTNYLAPIGIELGIYSPTLFYRGLVDIFYMDRVFGPSVTDFKTSNGYIKKGSVKELKYKLQLGAYANALEEMYASKKLLIKRSSILCVNTKSDTLQEVVSEGKELEHYKEEFKTLIKNYHIKNNQRYLIS